MLGTLNGVAAAMDTRSAGLSVHQILSLPLRLCASVILRALRKVSLCERLDPLHTYHCSLYCIEK